jgi:YggT family protein
MTLLWNVVAYVLYIYIILVLARVVLEITRQFSRSWRPGGIAAVLIEAVYLATDPPIRALRKLVPPLHLGTVSIDLSIIILLLAIVGLQRVALTLA